MDFGGGKSVGEILGIARLGGERAIPSLDLPRTQTTPAGLSPGFSHLCFSRVRLLVIANILLLQPHRHTRQGRHGTLVVHTLTNAIIRDVQEEEEQQQQ